MPPSFQGTSRVPAKKNSPQRLGRTQRGILEPQILTDETQIKNVAILLRKMKAERAMDVASSSRLLVRIASLDILRSFLSATSSVFNLCESVAPIQFFSGFLGSSVVKITRSSFTSATIPGPFPGLWQVKTHWFSDRLSSPYARPPFHVKRNSDERTFLSIESFQFAKSRHHITY